MKRAFVMALTSAIIFSWTASSQTAISGSAISSTTSSTHGLFDPGTSFSAHPVSIYNSSLPVPTYFYYWSCGGGNDGICVGERTPGGSVSNVSKAITAGSTVGNGTIVCDIQDPGVVYFDNGVQSYYYLYADAVIKDGSSCGDGSNNEHAAIYGWYSSNGTSFTPLNSGNPLIQFPDDAAGCWSCGAGGTEGARA